MSFIEGLLFWRRIQKRSERKEKEEQEKHNEEKEQHQQPHLEDPTKIYAESKRDEIAHRLRLLLDDTERLLSLEEDDE